MATSRKTTKGVITRGKPRTIISYYSGLHEIPYDGGWVVNRYYNDGFPAAFVADNTLARVNEQRDFLGDAIKYHTNSHVVLDRKKNLVKYKDVDNFRKYTSIIPNSTYKRYNQKAEKIAGQIVDWDNIYSGLDQLTAENIEKKKIFTKLGRHKRVTKGRKSHRS